MENIPGKENPPIEISAETPEDVEGVQHLLYKTWLATYPNEQAGVTKEDIEDRFKNRFSEEEVQKRRKRVETPKEGEAILVARDTGKVIGFCRGIRKDDVNQLQAIYVLPEYQGKGIGQKLWEEVSKSFDGNKDTIVEVVEYNQDAIKFYEKLGFEDTGERFENENFRMKSGSILPELRMRRKAK